MAKLSAQGNAKGANARFLREARELRQQLQDTMRDVADDAEIHFAAFALKGETGRLSRGISARPVGNTIQVEAHAESHGYDYVGVTRFGHRKEWIYPRSDRAPASVGSTRGARGTVQQGNAALAFKFKGKLTFRKRVKGFKPTSDWAKDALPEIQQDAEERLAAFGRGFLVRLT